MQWLINTCYLGSVVVYLVAKVYFQNEVKDCFDNCSCDGDSGCGSG